MGFAEIKRLLFKTKHSNLDVDLRYYPVLRFLRKVPPGSRVLEIGPGTLGISPYILRTVVGVDTMFTGEPPANLLPVVARGMLPFRDSSFPVVLSLDTLEHVPREYRQLFINEAIRTAEQHVIIGFPEGEHAERHDSRMETYYAGQLGEAHRYFVEHREYRIPRRAEVLDYLEKAQAGSIKTFSVRRIGNVNISLRTLFMSLAWHRWRIFQRLYIALSLFARLDRLLSLGRQYRSIYFITLKKTVDAE